MSKKRELWRWAGVGMLVGLALSLILLIFGSTLRRVVGYMTTAQLTFLLWPSSFWLLATSGRRYAIGALGHIGDRRAYETLKAILDDAAEVSYFRRDALEAIALIDPVAGQREAKRYRDSQVADLAQASSELLSGHSLQRKRFVRTLVGVD